MYHHEAADYHSKLSEAGPNGPVAHKTQQHVEDGRQSLQEAADEKLKAQTALRNAVAEKNRARGV